MFVVHRLPSTAFLSRSISSTPAVLSGHNKWSKIKAKKAVNDAAKAAVYTKARSDILIAVRTGGSPDPESNQALAVVLKRAKAQGVPKENIEKALDRARGGKNKADQHLVYEVIARGSVGVLVECLTDNTNRTMHAVRELLGKHKARMAPVAFQFQRKGCVRVSIPKSLQDYDARMNNLIESALEAGAEDFEEADAETGAAAEVEFISPPTELAQLTSAVTSPASNTELLSSELIYQPTEDPPEDPELDSQIGEMVQALEELEDVLCVWTTLDR